MERNRREKKDRDRNKTKKECDGQREAEDELGEKDSVPYENVSPMLKVETFLLFFYFPQLTSWYLKTFVVVILSLTLGRERGRRGESGPQE